MALNYSHRPLFSAHTSENSLWSPLRAVNGCLPENSHEKPWHVSKEQVDEWHFIEKDKGDHHCCSSESNSSDIVDLLPSDPFEMDIKTTVTAIKGWLEDLDIVDYGGYVKSNSRKYNQESYDLFAGWNLIWNNALKFQPFSGSVQSNEKVKSAVLSSSSSPQVSHKADKVLDVINNVDEYGEMGEMEGVSDEGTSCVAELQFEEDVAELQFGEKVEGAAQSEEVPHDAFKFCLMYLGVKDLLSVERVSSYLRSEVRGEPLLWKSIHIEQPLNEKITDDILFELASRADGTLRSLSLVQCPKITDDGINRVLKTNPRLTKVSFTVWFM